VPQMVVFAGRLQDLDKLKLFELLLFYQLKEAAYVG